MEKKREGDSQRYRMHGFSIGTEIVLEMRDGSERVETKDKFCAQSCNVGLSRELRKQKRAFSREVTSGNSMTITHPVGGLLLQPPVKEKVQ